MLYGKKIKKSNKKGHKKDKKKRVNVDEELQKTIRKNIYLWKEGVYSSREQAIAVSYSQIKKKYPRSKYAKK